MNHALKSLFSVALLGLTAAATAAPVTTTLTNDRWNYPFNGTPGTRNNAGIFNSNIATFGFNARDGQAVIQFATTNPLVPESSFTVTSARLEVWSLPNAPWDPSTTTLELYAAGFGPSIYKELLSDPGAGVPWTETSTFIGGGPAPTSRVPRDPFPRDYVDNSHAEDNITTATPWSVGSNPDYTAVNTPTTTFKVTFDLPVGDTTMQQELQADVQRGVSSWVVSTNYVSTGQGDSNFPSIYLNGIAPVPAPADTPKLFIEVSPKASVNDWQMYY